MRHLAIIAAFSAGCWSGIDVSPITPEPPTETARKRIIRCDRRPEKPDARTWCSENVLPEMYWGCVLGISESHVAELNGWYDRCVRVTRPVFSSR